MSDYDVVLLIEQPFTAQDATNLRQLHEDIEDPVRYHVMLPVEDASARVETAMGSLGRITEVGDLPPRKTLVGLVKKRAELNEIGVRPAKPAASQQTATS